MTDNWDLRTPIRRGRRAGDADSEVSDTSTLRRSSRLHTNRNVAAERPITQVCQSASFTQQYEINRQVPQYEHSREQTQYEQNRELPAYLLEPDPNFRPEPVIPSKISLKSMPPASMAMASLIVLGILIFLWSTISFLWPTKKIEATTVDVHRVIIEHLDSFEKVEKNLRFVQEQLNFCENQGKESKSKISELLLLVDDIQVKLQDNETKVKNEENEMYKIQEFSDKMIVKWKNLDDEVTSISTKAGKNKSQIDDLLTKIHEQSSRLDGFLESNNDSKFSEMISRIDKIEISVHTQNEIILKVEDQISMERIEVNKTIDEVIRKSVDTAMYDAVNDAVNTAMNNNVSPLTTNNQLGDVVTATVISTGEKFIVDWASESLGARIDRQLTSPGVGRTWYNLILDIFGHPNSRYNRFTPHPSAPPDVVLHRLGGSTDRCFAITPPGQITIDFRWPLRPSMFVISHLPIDIGSTPKNFSVLGWMEDETSIPLGDYTYSDPQSFDQSYTLQSGQSLRKITFNFHNSQSGVYTCIYGIRVFGEAERNS
eukprot:GHVL01009010.1.p1 GENE.GHVL01009010.1~~GHVL01009010.1.p1  ORF type:complete len:542 (+),score=100.65 GHVL01009010.1:34-1659(+)